MTSEELQEGRVEGGRLVFGLVLDMAWGRTSCRFSGTSSRPETPLSKLEPRSRRSSVRNGAYGGAIWYLDDRA